MNYDVICIGGGGTGLAAAAAAARAGASVLVLEKRHVLGGNSNVASGLFAAESPAHERLNIVAPKDELFRAAVEYAHWNVNAPLLRAFIDRSPHSIAWLEGLGVEFPWIPPLFEDQNPPTWHVADGGGSAIVEAMAASAEALGATLLTNAPVESVARDGVRIVVRASIGGVNTTFTAGALVIGTGGYGGNADMLARYCPDFNPSSWFCTGLRHDGSGIRFGWELGAAPEGLGLCEFHAPSVQGPLFLSLALREPTALIVNTAGERFFDEGIVDNAFESANAVRRQPGQIAFGILDKPMSERVLAKAANKARGPLYADQMADSEQFRRLLEGLGGQRGGVANSMEELAGIVGCETDQIVRTVGGYNRFCESGYDRDFGKQRRYLTALTEPPFYVLRGAVGFFNTIGGLRVSERLELVNAEEQPLPGLYAGGVDVGGWQGDTYNFYLAGGSLGFAINSGAIAGENAAAYALATRTA